MSVTETVTGTFTVKVTVTVTVTWNCVRKMIIITASFIDTVLDVAAASDQ